MKLHIYSQPRELQVTELLAGLDSYTFSQGTSESQKLCLLDSFDWRLHNKALPLIHDGTRLFHCDPESFLLDPLNAQEQETRPRFAEELPPSQMTTKLQGLLEERALIPLVQLSRTITSYRILNKQMKTVVLLEAHSFETQNGSSLGYLSCKPMRGYAKAHKALLSILQAADLKAPTQPLIQALYKAAGKEPGAYSGKMNLKLEPQQTAETAMCILYSHLLQTMRDNLEGIHKDIDTEFLHDFRVAVRRTRSGLSQVKGVLPPTVVATAKANFAALGNWTGLTRDLDVYLLKRDQYLAMVPQEMVTDLHYLFDHLVVLRQEALAQLLGRFNSQEFADILQSWASQLAPNPTEASETQNVEEPRTEESETPNVEEPLTEASEALNVEEPLTEASETLNVEEPHTEESEAPNAQRPIVVISGLRIYKKYSTIRKMSLMINSQSPDTDLHDLRIECKKLRYLLEFFKSLYAPELVSELVRRLKYLQTVLGDFNDLYVQSETLTRLALELKPPNKRLRRIILAIGSLLGILHQQQRELKQECIKRVAEFLEEETHRRFRYFKEYQQGKDS